MIVYASLFTLTIQNAGIILLLRYVRTRGGDEFQTTTAVVISECLKLCACLIIIFAQQGGVHPFLHHLKTTILDQPRDCLKISIPSIIYVVQNNLFYVAVSNLDAATYQVTYQLKILTTAIFSVFMLNKKVTMGQWISLLLLFAGVSVVQLERLATADTTGNVPKEQNALLGLIAVLISSLMSGFAGVYFEKVLKGTTQTVWLRNVQLGLFGSILGLITMQIKDGRIIEQRGVFFGYDMVVWLVVLLQAFGGLIVAIVVKYADNIMKGFATSAAIVISCIVSIYLFNFQVSLPFTAGVLLVIVSTFLYNKYESVSPSVLPSTTLNPEIPILTSDPLLEKPRLAINV